MLTALRPTTVRSRLAPRAWGPAAVARRACLAIGAASLGLWLQACSPDATTTASTGSQRGGTSVATGTASSSAALRVALAATELPPAAAGFRQTRDGALGGTADTDARVFTNSDGAIVLEIDIVAYRNLAEAANGYPAFMSAAAKQVTVQSATATPVIGQRGDEYSGTDAGGRSSVSLSFLERSYVVVVTMKSAAGILDPATIEAIARAQDSRIIATR